MKKLILSVVAMMIAATSFAQETVVASLSHEGETTMFYGLTALAKAAEKAQSGDIINLSRGIFNATTIKAGITLRGAGIDSDDPTYINGSLTIQIPTEDTNHFTIEGIICNSEMKMTGTFSSPQIVKCKLSSGFTTGSTKDNIDILVVNSKVLDHFNVGGVCRASLINSYVDGVGFYDDAHFMGLNCVLWKDRVDLLHHSVWKNCIFFSARGYGDALPTDSECTNCVGVNYGNDPFRNLTIKPNCSRATYAEAFKDFTGTYTDEQTFELSAEAKANENFKGTDGTEVGLYGGPQPFNLTLSYPLISKMEVGEKTDEKGQLEVTIGVK
ncbi:MAG: hypothetical protein IK075_03060 [Prevotella sp.]|nr:hypothetical protein [Prevotella sp.]